MKVLVKSPALDGCKGIVRGEKHECWVIEFTHVARTTSMPYFQLPCTQVIDKRWCEEDK